ncbi:MAG: heavy-metal-associated domain-containing protein [Eubacterium sp.]|nr:heavy-metal-associated domain-containing protein [Eubacterium sp.]
MKMIDIVVILIVILLVFVIIFPMIKKIANRETCCGTKREKTPRKHLSHVAGQYVLTIEGMRCSNCQRQVTNAINAIDGLSAKVSLENNEAIVSYEDKPRKEEAIEAIQKLDFLAYLK